MTKTNAERQEALRQRKREAGLKEIRNIYASPEHEALIKKAARLMSESDKFRHIVTDFEFV